MNSNINKLINQLAVLSAKYEINLLKTAEERGGTLAYTQYRPSLVKHYADEIDELLAKHYGFTEEELDFIINYDIKYRMGDRLNGED